MLSWPYMKFKGTVRKFDRGLWTYHIIVPQAVFEAMSADGDKRVICTLDSHPPFHAGFMPDGKGNYFIKLNKEKMLDWHLSEGQELSVQLEKDKTRYGMALPDEFAAVMESDPEGLELFDALSAGKRRSLIYIVGSVKSPDRRIGKALVIFEHLKANEGKLDFKALNEALKNPPY